MLLAIVSHLAIIGFKEARLNDNEPFAYHEDDGPSDVTGAQDEQLTKCKLLAEKAIRRPGMLTNDQVRDLGWGLLVAIRRLKEHEADAAWNIGEPAIIAVDPNH